MPKIFTQQVDPSQLTFFFLLKRYFNLRNTIWMMFILLNAYKMMDQFFPLSGFAPILVHPLTVNPEKSNLYWLGGDALNRYYY